MKLEKTGGKVERKKTTFFDKSHPRKGRIQPPLNAQTSLHAEIVCVIAMAFRTVERLCFF